MNKLKIVTVDDNPDILDVLEATLEDDFIVIKAETGQEGIDKIKSEKPDIVILDYMLPDTIGIEVCKKIRQDPLLIHLPILMLTGKGEVEDKVEGLNAGVDDYMVKPFSPTELLARVQMLLRRSSVNLDANPLTRLPGNVSINSDLEKKIQNKEPFSVLYIDLDHFKALNDAYGFERGDDVIKECSRVIINSVQEVGNINDFIGHIGGDDFVVITSNEAAEELAQCIINNFDKKSPTFYEEEDRKKGYIETKDRSGITKKFSLVTVSIGIINSYGDNFRHIAEIGAIGADLKKAAKQNEKSSFVTDRRSE